MRNKLAIMLVVLLGLTLLAFTYATRTPEVVIYASCTQWNDLNCERLVPVSPLREMAHVPQVGDTVEFKVGNEIRTEKVIDRIWGTFTGNSSDAYDIKIVLKSAEFAN